jgi:ATP-dependent DNA helicase RecG
MQSAIVKLVKILNLERDMGYMNRAVIGGLDKFAPHWREEALSQATTDAARSAIEEICDLLRTYSSLETTAQKAECVDDLLGRLRALEAGAVPAPPAVPETPAEPEERAEDKEPVSMPPLAKPGVPAAPAEPLPAVPKPEEPPAAPPAPAGARSAALEAEVTTLPRVGQMQAKRLEKLGIRTIEDLLYHFPRRYDDYSRLKLIHQLRPGDEVTVLANVRQTTLRQLDGGRTIIKCIVTDGTGQLELTWFNQPFLEKRLAPGTSIVVSGRVEQFLGRLTMNSPEWEPLDKEHIHTGRMVPVYPLTEGVTNRWLRRLINKVVETWADRVEDFLPEEMRRRLELYDLGTALREVHFPASEESLAKARRRLAFDELFLLQVGVLRLRQAWRRQTGQPLPTDRPALERFLASLPFTLTGAQQRALDEILRDMAQPVPMNRLLQGDVGSGKTVIAAAAALMAARSGFQTAVMVPTEILAHQHYARFQSLLGQMMVPANGQERPLRVRLLVGSMPPAEKRQVYDEAAAGEVDVIVGTHALIQENVQFARLALVIIDEQHRFGVSQRGALRQKGYSPHMLVMTATPIPRTLSLTLYGDLDLSIIDELPPGRQPIKTYIVTHRERERAYQFVRSQVAEGHQAFIICPLVEESENIEARAAVAEYERLSREVFPNLRLGLLHGRMPAEEKEEVMRRFSAGELDILVSTAVVEVGIDVPNATVMLIEGADRFGMAQLHQFRGRVGRGSAPSYCLLLTENTSEDAWERLRAVAESQDGFALAEKDLELRGPGEFFGTRQSGLPDLRMASLADIRLLELARREAYQLLEQDPELSRPEHQALRRRVERAWAQRRTDIS